MGIGSFLATASDVQTGMLEGRQRLRADRQQQLALEELNRQDEFRRLQLEAPTTELPAQGLLLGAPMQVAEPEFAPAGIPTAGLIAPAGAPAAAATGAPAAATPKPAVPKPAGGKVMRIAGVVIQPWDTNRPNRLNAGVAGFEKVDPNASDVTQYGARKRNETKLNATLGQMASAANTQLSTIRKPFATQTEKARMELGDTAARWYRSGDAKDYFSRNPEMLEVASKNPVNFYDGLVKANQFAQEKAKAPKAAPAAPRTAAPTQAELTTASARSGSFADIPFSQVKSFITGREGPAHLGGYNAIAYNTSSTTNKAGVPQPPRPLTSMTIKEVLDFQRNVMRPATRGYRGKNDVGSTGVGAYQFESGTLAENARIALGDNWTNTIFSPEVQDRIAETLYNRVRGDRKTLGNTWFAFRGVSPSDPQLAGGVAPAGVNTGTTPVAAPVRIDPSNFYLADQNMISQDMRVAVQNRQELARMADMYRRAGMGDQFTQARLKLIDLDNSLLFLQGMQGIQELGLANDPRRLAAVWSQYAGVPIQLQPQTDGTYNVVVNGRITQRGVASSTIIDSARSAFDAEYRKSRSESSSAMALEQFKSQLRIGEEAAKAVLQAAREAQNELLRGKNARATEIIKQLDPNGKITPLGGDGGAILQVQGQTFILDPGGNPIEGSPNQMTAPSAKSISGLPTRSVDVGVGG